VIPHWRVIPYISVDFGQYDCGSANSGDRVGLPLFQVTNPETNQVVATHVVEAKGSWASFKGLMFRDSLQSGHGMLFRPARGIHTNFMRFPIDLVFLDKENRVTKIREAMGPWR
jgi:uncharacterized membrane protein (UPF0127 family)